MFGETVYDPKIHDLTIIGAGPAGLSSAYYAARNGIDTIVIEEHKEIGVPVHCGECLSDIAVKRMGLDIPKEAISENIKGVRVIFPNEMKTEVKEKGYVLEKELFEQYLAKRALDAGAKIKMNSRVIKANRKFGIWSVNATTCAIKSKMLIDASGFQSITNKLNPGINNKTLKTVNGVQYLMEDIANDGYLEFYIWPKYAPHGYLWIIPKKDGKANVGLVSSDSKNIHKNLREFLEKKGLEKKKIIKPFGGIIPESGPLMNTFFDGLIMVGDAAGFTSPMFEGGTQLALKSGQFAGELVSKIKKESNGINDDIDVYKIEKLEEYEKLWLKEFPPYKKLLKGKEIFYSYSEDELNTLAQILPADLTNLSMSTKLKIGYQLLTKGNNLLRKNVMDALNAFSYSTGKNYGW